MIAMATSEANTRLSVFRNSIMYVTNGPNIMRSGQWTSGQIIHSNNVYKLSGGGVLNFTLGATELQSTANFWNNTTNANPLYWDLHPATNSLLINVEFAEISNFPKFKQRFGKTSTPTFRLVGY
jgi:hypothetical protein